MIEMPAAVGTAVAAAAAAAAFAFSPDPERKTNGIVNDNNRNNNVDGADAAGSLEALCHDLRRGVDGFLARRAGDDEALRRSTQEQVRVARDVIDEALRRYRCVCAAAVAVAVTVAVDFSPSPSPSSPPPPPPPSHLNPTGD